MKCVDFSLLPEPVRLMLLSAIMAFAADGHAESARFIVIDAREGLTPDVLEAYTNAVGGNAKAALVEKRIRILASNRYGFDVGQIAIPDHVRQLDLDITVMLQKGQRLHTPVKVNEITVSRRSPARIAQSTKILGR